MLSKTLCSLRDFMSIFLLNIDLMGENSHIKVANLSKRHKTHPHFHVVQPNSFITGRHDCEICYQVRFLQEWCCSTDATNAIDRYINFGFGWHTQQNDDTPSTHDCTNKGKPLFPLGHLCGGMIQRSKLYMKVIYKYIKLISQGHIFYHKLS